MITIKDVAKKANVSVATVSRVINKKGNVNKETAKIVEKAIKELNYIPNELARSLYLKQSKLLAVLIPHFGTYFYSSLVEGIESKAMELGYKIILCNTKDNLEREAEYISILQRYSVDGIILASNARNIDKLINSKLPIVTVDHILAENIPSITSNNLLGGQMAAQRLMLGGARYVLEYRGPGFLLTVSERSEGFRQVLVQNNIPFMSYEDDLINPDLYILEKILIENPHIDSIFATSDFLAMNALKVISKLGKRVPEDIQIVGFDDVFYSKLATPSITTIKQPIQKMGELAIETLIKILEEKPIDEDHQVVDVKLIERKSTR